MLFYKVLVVLEVLGAYVVADHLSDTLRHYETLHSRDIKHHPMKRSVVLGCKKKTISFKTLGREFLLHLRCQKGLLTPDFKVYRDDGNDTLTPIELDTSEFYEGYVEGEKMTSHVIAHYEGEALMATITTENNTYVVEPSGPHLPDSTRYNMISYRLSDMKLDMEKDPDHHMGHSYCGFVHPDVDEAAYVEPDHQEFERRKHDGPGRKIYDHNPYRRQKRALASGIDTCAVALVADYTFFESVGQGSEATTANFLINQLGQVDQIYRRTTFGEGHTNLGFEIAQITIHTQPTAVATGQTHYNMEVSRWETTPLLNAFGKGSNWDGYCLAHLFTARPFNDGVLGLGWVASVESNKAGGICSPKSGGNNYNTAWTSARNSKGNRILTQEMMLVTTHEFGHNWGSQHDGSQSECSPGSSNGGNYVMYMYAVSGFDPNNRVFSPCSTVAIDYVLESKAGNCFKQKEAAYCGNSKVEEGEECDAGASEDACCTPDCEFTSGSTCSDINSECCQNCQVAPSTSQCRSTGNLLTSCEQDAYCSGDAIGCPASQYKNDGTACVDEGVCLGGVCMSFCEQRGLISCACTEVDYSCNWCCRSAVGAACVPYRPDADTAYVDLPDGKQCVQGMCDAGVCEKAVIQLTDRLWDVIDNLSVNSFLRWVKDNIVIGVVFLSLLIYIPLCGIVAFIDYKDRKADEKERAWHNRDNDTLVLPEDSRRMRNRGTHDVTGSSNGGNVPRSTRTRSTRRSRGSATSGSSRIQIEPM